MTPAAGIGAGLACALGAGVAAAALVARSGTGRLLDDPRTAGAARARKLQERPVPRVGGLAVFAGLLAGELALRLATGAGLLDASPLGTAAWGALALALLVGWVDDWTPGGLSARAKLGGQLAAAAALAGAAWHAGEPPAGALLWGLAGLVAMNAVNLFDNADGAVLGVGAVGLLAAGSAAAGAVLALLPWNLVRARGAASAGPASVPRAYLGDAGSHLIGVLLVATWGAWPALVLPFVDALRVVLLRLRAGVPPWVGDRRHLAHALQAAGAGAGTIPALFAAATLPAAAGVVLARDFDLRHAAWMGGLASAGCALGLCVLAARRLRPCSASRARR